MPTHRRLTKVQDRTSDALERVGNRGGRTRLPRSAHASDAATPCARPQMSMIEIERLQCDHAGWSVQSIKLAHSRFELAFLEWARGTNGNFSDHHQGEPHCPDHLAPNDVLLPA
jgi:hypothetical protein